MKSFVTDELQYGNDMLVEINNMRINSQCCDFTIILSAEEIQVHRNILTAGSNYFKLMLLSDMLESQTNRVTMQELDAECVKKCIDFIYTGKSLDVEDDKLGELLHIAHMMQLHKLCNRIASSLEEELNMNTFFETKRLANTYELEDLDEKCDQFAMENFCCVSTDTNFMGLEKEYVSLLIESKATKASEGFKCKQMRKWVNFDLKNRGSYFCEMLLSLDISQFPLEYRLYLLKYESLVKNNAECVETLNIPVSDGETIRPRDIETPTKWNRISVFDTCRSLIKTWNPIDESTSEWEKTEHGIDVTMFDRNFSAVVLDHYIYVVLRSKALYRLRYTYKNAVWERMADMINEHGFNPPSTVLDGCIYVIGTDSNSEYSDIGEYYDPDTNRWTEIKRRNKKLTGSSLVSAQGLVYAIGGRNGYRKYSQVVEVYDPITMTWSYIEPMKTARSGVGALWDGYFIHAIGGYNGKILTTVEAYNPTSKVWYKRPNTLEPHEEPKTFFIKGKIYVVGGRGLVFDDKTVEVFDPKRNKWEVKDIIGRMDIVLQGTLAIRC